jgi:hypothetical protein
LTLPYLRDILLLRFNYKSNTRIPYTRKKGKTKGGEIVEKWQEAHSKTEDQDWTSRLFPEKVACCKAKEKRGDCHY